MFAISIRIESSRNALRGCDCSYAGPWILKLQCPDGVNDYESILCLHVL